LFGILISLLFLKALPSSIAPQLAPTNIRGFGKGDARRVSVEGALHAPFREQHWSAVFSSIYQHLDLLAGIPACRALNRAAF
jgi:hypothetical protein